MQRLKVALTAALVCTGSTGWADDTERSPGELYRQLDKNSDGRLEREEIPESQLRFFERLLRLGDKNQDRWLSLDEFQSALKEQEPRARSEEPGRPGGRGEGRPEFSPGQLFERFDRSGDGKLSKDELPEPMRDRLAPVFERLGKEDLTREEFVRALELAGAPGRDRPTDGRPEGRPGEGRPGAGRIGPDMLARMRELDRNGDGMVTLEEVPEEMRPRVREFLERIGRDAVNLRQMAEMADRAGPAGDRDRPRPESAEGDRPRPEGEGRPGPRDGDRPRPEFRDGERPPMPRDGDRPPMGREGDRPPMGREGDRPPMGREGDRPPMGREGDRPPMGREGDRPPMGRDGDRPPMGRDGDRPPMGREGEGRGPGGFVPPLFMLLDENRDGRISHDELNAAAKRFDELDRNGDGYLDRAELMGFPGGPRDGQGRPPFGPRDGEGRPPFAPRDGGSAGRPQGRPDGGRPEGDRPRGDRPDQEGGPNRPNPERNDN